MRKIERAMVDALRRSAICREGAILREANTTVTREHEGTLGTFGHHYETKVLLHGNAIARVEGYSNRLFIRTCGWPTATTCSRLNAVLEGFCSDCRVRRRKGELQLVKMVPVPSREHHGVVPCSAMVIGTVPDTEWMQIPGNY